jgi:thiol:disulfide interchange protein DsbD
MSRFVVVILLLAMSMLAGCGGDSESPAISGGDGTNASQPTAAETNGAAPTATFSSHGNLHFVDGYQAGYDRAIADGKPMLVFFTADWCHLGHQMADDAFTNPQVVGLAERFTCIRVDADAEPEVCQKFRVQGYPTVEFLSPRGAPLNRLVGKKPSHQVMMAMQAALQNVARRNDSSNPTKVR